MEFDEYTVHDFVFDENFTIKLSAKVTEEVDYNYSIPLVFGEGEFDTFWIATIRQSNGVKSFEFSIYVEDRPKVGHLKYVLDNTNEFIDFVIIGKACTVAIYANGVKVAESERQLVEAEQTEPTLVDPVFARNTPKHEVDNVEILNKVIRMKKKKAKKLPWYKRLGNFFKRIFKKVW
jgi:hypothetical protein